MKKQLITAAVALAGFSMAASAAVGSTATQDGYKLSLEYSVENISPKTATASRGGVGIGDRFFVNEYATGVKVYGKTGELEATIPATEGYGLWTSCNVDAAGHLLVQIDKTAFPGVNGAGNFTGNGDHGFMVIDPATLEVLNPFMPMTSSSIRSDAMAPVDKNILEDYNTRVLATAAGGPNALQYSYNQTAGVPAFWKAAAFSQSAGLDQFPAAAQKATSTGYALQFTDTANAVVMAMYPNPQYEVTYSAEGKYGNGIQIYTGNWKASGKYIHTPMHSGLAAFNIFTIKGKQYIVYPAGGATITGDAIAISEVTYIDSPATDMTMEGETLVDGKLAGPLKARVYAAMNEAGTLRLT